MSSLEELINKQVMLSWIRLRVHLGLLTRFPYNERLPQEIVLELEKWKKKWEEMDKEVAKK